MFEVTAAPMPKRARCLRPLREPGAYEALVREIGEDGACEVRDVFWSETCARLQLFRTLVARAAPRQDHPRSAFAEERGRNVRLCQARGAGAAAGAAPRRRLARPNSTISCDLMDAAYAAARAQEPQG